MVEARDIFIGVNAVDYSGYPDCRPEYIAAYETMANLATKAGVEGHPLRIHTPLIDLSKGEIIAVGTELKVPYAMTVSCYQANDQGEACGRCDSCDIRRAGFARLARKIGLRISCEPSPAHSDSVTKQIPETACRTCVPSLA